MKNSIIFSVIFFLLLTHQSNAQQHLSPEEKALETALHMHKRLGLKEFQQQQVYSLNLNKIQKSRTVKNVKANNPKRLGRDYDAIREEYNTRLRGVLTPEQYQRWITLKDEAKQRRALQRKHSLEQDLQATIAEEINDPESDLEAIVSR